MRRSPYQEAWVKTLEKGGEEIYGLSNSSRKKRGASIKDAIACETTTEEQNQSTFYIKNANGGGPQGGRDSVKNFWGTGSEGGGRKKSYWRGNYSSCGRKQGWWDKRGKILEGRKEGGEFLINNLLGV